MNIKQKTLLVMAGGTGGHIFPGIAVAEHLAKQGWHIHWLGTADKMEADIVPKHGFELSFINIAGVRGKGLSSLISAPFKIVQSVLQAKKVIKRVKPDVVLGMGGYASAPGGIAAWLTNTPLIIHEQNAVAGLSNRLLASFATKVLAAFPEAFKNKDVEVVGNPLRSNLATITMNEHNHNSEKNLLVVGGSLGAKVLNDTVAKTVKTLANEKLNVWHQCGAGHFDAVNHHYENEGLLTSKVKVTEFIDDMSQAYQWADVVICRAGALTVSELAMVGKPAIYVPLPHAVDDHQTKNALYLVKHGGGKLIAQHTLSPQLLAEELAELFESNQKLIEMAQAAKNAAYTDATEKVANYCVALAK